MSPRYVLRRLLQAAPTVLGILVISFVLVYLVPGNPTLQLAGENADPARLAEIDRQFGFDDPLHRQFLTYVGNVFTGDLGFSYSQGDTVASSIRQRLFPTILLTGSALLLSSLVGIVLGALAARRPYGVVDGSVTLSVLLATALPTFWLAQLMLLAFAIHGGWLPIGGYENFRETWTGWRHTLDVAHHMILPVVVLAATELALVARVTRAGLIEQNESDYARAALAKGLSPWGVIRRHELRNVLLPVVTILGLRAGSLFAGAVIIEEVFGWPGIGTLLVQAARQNDRPLMLGVVLLVSLTVVAVNVATDLVYGKIDPRVRVES